MSRTRVNRFQFEAELADGGITGIAGIDEVGRGPLAGPVVAAAVILPAEWYHTGPPENLRELNDSKQLTELRREEFHHLLTTLPGIRWALAECDAGEIDRLNILRATHVAMARALAQLQPAPAHVLVDGRPVPGLGAAQTALVKGDSRSYSIAAASVIAKVTRDRQMAEFDHRWPVYGFGRHKGYPTPEHLAAVAEHGPCPIHRRSFAPLKPSQAELF